MADPTLSRMATRPIAPRRWSAEGLREQSRSLMVETPVAIVFNGTTVAVMMASPQDIEDFAYGFALTEGYLRDLAEIERFEVIAHDKGLEARFWVAEQAAEALLSRRRAALGPMGCGLCGIDSLDQALRTLPPLGNGVTLNPQEVAEAPDQLRAFQPLHDQTRSAHAAGFLIPGLGITFAREDVGRHNALDKLCGALLREGIAPESGAIVMTSRLSVDLVQKSAMIGCPTVIGVSAPSLLAVETAEAAGMTLIANCKAGRFDILTGADRLKLPLSETKT
ncbi:formate dehydrogenase accessory sulfurtransferase FdhD [Celeribacter sp.]|uniref:formate dehydrogenase accessory sulfurtransferase FdhD n=1 Tax=Celeribacter sp. TaxID=1890673 RepID=UPI003A8CDDAD